MKPLVYRLLNEVFGDVNYQNTRPAFVRELSRLASGIVFDRSEQERACLKVQGKAKSSHARPPGSGKHGVRPMLDNLLRGGAGLRHASKIKRQITRRRSRNVGQASALPLRSPKPGWGVAGKRAPFLSQRLHFHSSGPKPHPPSEKIPPSESSIHPVVQHQIAINDLRNLIGTTSGTVKSATASSLAYSGGSGGSHQTEDEGKEHDDRAANALRGRVARASDRPSCLGRTSPGPPRRKIDLLKISKDSKP